MHKLWYLIESENVNNREAKRVGLLLENLMDCNTGWRYLSNPISLLSESQVISLMTILYYTK